MARAGTDTVEYKSVLSRIPQMTQLLEVTPNATENLKLQYQSRNWIGVPATATAKQLVDIALVRIQQDATQHKVFSEILSSVAGLQVIVTALEGIYM